MTRRFRTRCGVFSNCSDACCPRRADRSDAWGVPPAPRGVAQRRGDPRHPLIGARNRNHASTKGLILSACPPRFCVRSLSPADCGYLLARIRQPGRSTGGRSAPSCRPFALSGDGRRDASAACPAAGEKMTHAEAGTRRLAREVAAREEGGAAADLPVLPGAMTPMPCLRRRRGAPITCAACHGRPARVLPHR